MGRGKAESGQSGTAVFWPFDSRSGLGVAWARE